MFRLSFLSHLQVENLGYFNIKLTLFLNTRYGIFKNSVNFMLKYQRVSAWRWLKEESRNM